MLAATMLPEDDLKEGSMIGLPTLAGLLIAIFVPRVESSISQNV
jgi:hypothetical protein